MARRVLRMSTSKSRSKPAHRPQLVIIPYPTLHSSTETLTYAPTLPDEPNPYTPIPTFHRPITRAFAKLQPETYEIHDNGGRPFTVTIRGNRVTVEMDRDDYNFNENGEYVATRYLPEHLFDVTAEKIFLGKQTPDPERIKHYGESPIGNSILLKLGKNHYRFIGWKIYDFRLAEGDTEIVDYFSDVGNSDVPYPYAVGKTHMYMMLDDVAVEHSFFKSSSMDIYEQFYEAESYIPLALRGGGRRQKSQVENRDEAKARVKELKEKKQVLEIQMIVDRLY